MFLYCVGLLEFPRLLSGQASTYYIKYACGFPRCPPCLELFLAFVRCNIKPVIVIARSDFGDKAISNYLMYLKTRLLRFARKDSFLSFSAIFSFKQRITLKN